MVGASAATEKPRAAPCSVSALPLRPQVAAKTRVAAGRPKEIEKMARPGYARYIYAICASPNLESPKAIVVSKSQNSIMRSKPARGICHRPSIAQNRDMQVAISNPIIAAVSQYEIDGFRSIMARSYRSGQLVGSNSQKSFREDRAVTLFWNDASTRAVQNAAPAVHSAAFSSSKSQLWRSNWKSSPKSIVSKRVTSRQSVPSLPASSTRRPICPRTTAARGSPDRGSGRRRR